MTTVLNFKCSYADPDDYTGIQSQSLTFDADNTRRIVPIPVKNDNVLESIENFFATLSVDSNQNPGVRISPEKANVSITDDDGEETH